jgi:hypothetical protein
MGVTLYGQGIDPTFGGFSVKAQLVRADDYSISTNLWGVAGGGPSVNATIVENNSPSGFDTIREGLTYSLIVWSFILQPSGVPQSISDYVSNSGWPSNGGLMFHSVLVTYSYD